MAENKVKYYVRIDDKFVEADMKDADGKVKKSSSGFGKSVGLALGTAFVAAGAAATKFGMDFETSMAKASTLIDTNVIDMGKLQGSVLELSDKTGVAASELGETMYNALSSGVKMGENGADMMAYLEKNTRLAKAGFTDVDTAVTATAKIMNAYKMTVEDTDKIHKILMQTQNNGITTVGELGACLAQVTPTAAAMGVGFDQVGASLATMTAQGTPTAQATTQLNSLFAELGKNGTTASKILKEKTGKSFQLLIQEGKSLSEILSIMQTNLSSNAIAISDLMSTADVATGKTMTFEEACQKLGLTENDVNGELIDMFGSIEAGKAALSMTGANAEQFTSNLSAMGTEADVVGEAFEKVSDTSAEKFNKMMNNLKNMGIELFASFAPLIDTLFPVLNSLLQTLAPIIGMVAEKLAPIIEKFLPLLEKVLGFVADAFIRFMKPIGDLIDAVLPPLMLALDILIDPLIELADMIIPIITSLLRMMIPVIEDYAKNMLPTLAMMFKQIIEAVKPIVDALFPILIDLFNQLIPPIMDLMDAVLPCLIKVFNSLIEPLSQIIQSILPVLSQMFNALIPVLVSLVEFITPVIEIFLGLVSTVLDFVMPVIKFLVDIIGNNLGGAFEGISGIIDNVIGYLTGLIDFIKNVFSGNWKGAWDAVCKMFSNLWEGLVNIVKYPINSIIDAINGVFKGINGIKIPDWVPFVGGSSFNISLIPRLKKGASFIPKDYFPAFLDYGERVLTKEENEAFTAMGGLDGMMAGAYAGGENLNITLTGNVYMDDRKMGTVVLKNIDSVVKSHGG